MRRPVSSSELLLWNVSLACGEATFGGCRNASTGVLLRAAALESVVGVWRGDFRGLVPPKDVIESLEEPLEPSYLYRGAISGFWDLKTHVHDRWAFSIQFDDLN
jgi:hypothetical protein